MTAEIAILNRSGVALAADSAVTVGQKRVWKSSNKLFSLGPANDIGLMIYGSGDHAGYPWEILIKLFKKEVSSTRVFSTVHEAMNSFFSFISTERFLDGEMDDLNTHLLFVKFLHNLKSRIRSLSKLEIRSELRKLATSEREKLEREDIIFEVVSLVEFRAKYSDVIMGIAKETFEQAIPQALYLALSRYLYEAFRRENNESGFETGVIFAGYGAEENFPTVLHSIVDGKYCSIPRWWRVRESNLNTDRRSRGKIIPFAQADIAYLFMEGISIGYVPYIRQLLTDVLAAKSDDIIEAYIPEGEERVVEKRRQELDDRKLVRRVMSEFAEFRNKNLIQPVMEVVGSLPKEEMAAMAEALVELTSLRRKVDSRLESVGGPVDVAVISKGDGFIWIKRKHYFSLDVNPDFLTRRGAITHGGHDEQRERE